MKIQHNPLTSPVSSNLLRLLLHTEYCHTSVMRIIILVMHGEEVEEKDSTHPSHFTYLLLKPLASPPPPPAL